jgi:hypothetical protein|uniref:Uncharacterized protein n=1 Tax=Siphoviridae sp. ct0Wl9 TaxID=2827763 RepID=A0A8S5T8Z2_9CAUD|nr:MAG TPA: hypothetical protein [Siphoviridae sp. ct0Wl9]
MAEFGKLNFAVAFNPQTAFPLDARYYFDSLSAAQTAAEGAVEVGSASGTYFFGQTVVVVESSVATLYVIQPDKTLKPVGSTVLGDGKSITVVEGKVQLVGFSEAQPGQQPRIGDGGSLEWYTPDSSTVEGLQQTVGQLQTDVSELQGDVGTINDTLETKANVSDVYTQTQTDAKIAAAISSTYKPSGSVEFASLPIPSADNLGNVYNVTDAFTAGPTFIPSEQGQKYPADTNVAVVEVDGSYYFDALSGFVDLTGYLTTAEAAETYATITQLGNKVDKVSGSSLVQDTLITKLTNLLNIQSVADGQLEVSPEGQLSILSISQSQVTGLTDTLAGKVDTEEGKGLSANDFTNTLLEKLNGIEAGAEVNVIESISLNSVPLEISGKAVNIPIATVDALGVVQSTAAENGVTVTSNGSMEVNSINVMKLAQTAGDALILNGGSSTAPVIS